MSDTIVNLTEDLWGSVNYDLPCGLYFYYLNEGLPGWDTINSGNIIGNCPSIQSIQFVPFIEPWDLILNRIPYDVDRFGSIENLRPGLREVPDVYRVMGIDNPIKTLGTFKCYNPVKSIGGDKNWRNESRLYNYPYAFAMLTDNLNTPMEIKYHLCKYNTSTIKVRSTISDRCSYGLYIEDYKGDTNGKLESVVSGDAHELPSSSSTYNQWFASNKNQVAQNVNNVMQNSFLTKRTSDQMLGANLVGQLSNANLNPLSVVGSGANIAGGLINHNATQTRANMDVQQAISGKMAQTSDILSTPNTMISMGSDVYYGLDKGSKKVNLFRFGIQESQYQKLGDYFAMFGYKQNKIMRPNIRNRHYYNYIKTTGVNISSNYIPRNHMEKLKEIFDKGVTVWHIDRANVVVGDYSKDNYEI